MPEFARNRWISALALLATLSMTGCRTLPDGPAEGSFVSRSVTVGGVARAYQVFVPASPQQGKRPVVLFLHGSGERGDDGRAPTLAGLGPYVRSHAAEFPAVVVFPQVPAQGEWMGANLELAVAALDQATREFNGDPDRTYLTGMSMGGYGTWELALAQPRRFAALVPVCGALKQIGRHRALYVTAVAAETDPYAALASRLGHLPIWIFHGARDDVVPPEDDRRIYAALKVTGADVQYTEFPDANHNSWDATYRNADMWQWLFSHRRP